MLCFNDVRISMCLEKYEKIYEGKIREIISYIRCGLYLRIINVSENTQIVRYTMSNQRNHYLNVVQHQHKDQCHLPVMLTLYGCSILVRTLVI